jgi:hypothetical protein
MVVKTQELAHACAMPRVCFFYREDSMASIHSIVPYEPRKRARDAEMAQNERETRELVGGV